MGVITPEYYEELYDELSAARAEIDMMGIRYAAAEMHHANNMKEVTEQRDRLLNCCEITCEHAEDMLDPHKAAAIHLPEMKIVIETINQKPE